MNKLYKYRPLSEFLFKELLYQELYFASYSELNDPLDLSARIEFTAEKEEQVGYLIKLLFKTTLIIPKTDILTSEQNNNSNLIDFYKNKSARFSFRKNIYNKLIQLKKEHRFIWIDSIVNVIIEVAQEEQITFNINVINFKSELERLAKKFLENSFTTCFSSTNKDFLMWSHYATKHSGICLEFTLDHSGQFPYLMKGKRKKDIDKYLQSDSKWEVDEIIFWDKIHQVDYQDEQPYINFFDFLPVFDNEHNCDLIGLSKSWTHKFAEELELVFSTKTKPWSYEKEWRAIEINFGEPQHPEERIRHYPLEVLTGVYFGIRTPENVKKRIHNIFNKLGKEIQFFDGKPTNGRDLDFEIWEDYDN
ncbi:MAG: DUF2971 domain-containing protein [Bacteroidales bacterium]|nr:DUF2971 domain-containing protein [Bacteroidales bacterium]